TPALAFAAEPTDIESNLTMAIGGAEKNVSLAEAIAALSIPAASMALIDQDRMKLQDGGPYGLGTAVRDIDGSLIVMKRGQNVGYHGYLIPLPAEGQGLVVMTNSDNGSILAEALIRRVAQLYRWPPIGALPD